MNSTFKTIYVEDGRQNPSDMCRFAVNVIQADVKTHMLKGCLTLAGKSEPGDI
jgi:hypothetical protein